MRKRISHIIFGLSLLGISACSYLDYNESLAFDDNSIWQDFGYITRYLSSVYNQLPTGFDEVGGGFRDCATDNAEHLNQNSNITKFNTGVWNSFSNPDDRWLVDYIGIRRANTFIEKADTVTLYYDQYDLANKKLNLEDLGYFRGEARFLKAFFYFDLMKRYGEIPLAEEWTDMYTPDDFKRSSIDDVVGTIAKYWDEALTYLPSKSTLSADRYNAWLGRPFKGSAYALKCRAYLYAASPLFNPDGETEYYEKCVESAIEIFKLKEYSLAQTYGELFEPNSSTMQNNTEVLWDRRYAAAKNLETANFPVGYYDGNGLTNPTQDLVDAYEFIDGSRFDWSNDEHVKNIYKNRDSRFYATILYNGAEMQGRQVECFEGGKDASSAICDGTRTGYYLKKYIKTNANLVEGETSRHYWRYFRYAQVVLNYAKALNEIAGPSTDVYSCGKTALSALNEVRARAGQPQLQGLSQQELREAIRRERRVELAFEGHRFWDVRRWKIAEETLGVPIHGVKIEKLMNGEFVYTPFEVEDRVFQPKMYLYPLPSSEALIAGHLEQTPGW